MRLLSLCAIFLVTACASAGEPVSSGQKWVVSWAASIQGPYPIGNPSAQPDMSRVFPAPAAGARELSFRLIVRPTLWGRETRIRMSNALGTKPVTFDGVYVGLQNSGAEITGGTNRAVTFGGKRSVTVAPGQSVWSDAVALPFVRDAASNELAGRKLAVSFHVVGESGPMTWHAKALQSSYITWPGAGAKGHDENEGAFPFATAAWYFLDALDMRADGVAYAVVAFGDSITDGTASTINGDDRWPDVLGRRLRAAYGNRIAVVNAGIGGNQVVGPAVYPPPKPFPGGPSALSRLERDVLTLSGVGAVIWLEGTNDFSTKPRPIRRLASCAPSSCPTTPPVAPATSCIRTVWAMARWARRSISICSRRNPYDSYKVLCVPSQNGSSNDYHGILMPCCLKGA